jgi:hypothetical protein
MTTTSERGTPERGKLRIAPLRAPAAPSINANDTVLRATGILMFLAIGAIHFLQIVPTAENTPLLGVAFLFLIAASLIVAVGLIQRSDRRLWAAGAGVCVAAVGGYAFTRTFSTPIDNQDVGNWSCMLGMAALFVETTLLALSLYAARGQRALQTAVTRLQEVRPRRVTPRDPNAA